MSNRVIVIGLDGATFRFIGPLQGQGQLPNIGRLMKQGTWAPLLSTIPYATIPAWPSFMTGMNPGKYGVFDFFIQDQAGNRRIVQSGNIAAKPLWEILSDYGKRCVVMNVPCTYPPRPINGVIVSGMLTPQGARFCQPPEIESFLHQAVGGYRINERADLPADHHLISDLYVVTQKQKEAFAALLRQNEWDFAMLMLRGTDIVCHMFWEDRSVIEDFYQFVDLLVGDLLEEWPDAAVFLMSDHGFQAQERDFHINRWLIDQGLLKLRRTTREEASWSEIRKLDGKADLRKPMATGSFPKTLQNLRITKAALKRVLPSSLWEWGRRHLPRTLKGVIPVQVAAEVDVKRSQATAMQQFGMETKGISILTPVTSSEYEQVRKHIIESLLKLRDPETGSLIVSAAHRREDLYKGPYVNRAPDIVLELEEGYNITNSFITKSYITRRERLRGCHHREGIFIASGNEIKQGNKLTDQEIYIWDLAPTILHCFGLPIPDKYDGRVLKEIFEEGSEAKEREVIYIERGLFQQGEEGTLSEAQQKEIEERLRNLGYL